MLTNQIFQLNKSNVPDRSVNHLVDDLRGGFNNAIRNNQPLLAMQYMAQIFDNMAEAFGEGSVKPTEMTATEAREQAGLPALEDAPAAKLAPSRKTSKPAVKPEVKSDEEE